MVSSRQKRGASCSIPARCWERECLAALPEAIDEVLHGLVYIVEEYELGEITFRLEFLDDALQLLEAHLAFRQDVVRDMKVLALRQNVPGEILERSALMNDREVVKF
ncbi:MAG: hypothetical protein JWM52_364 [Candidatus Saccharibacteria bacterium]|nr:hypothetical protein [Candidatus Saccharibacteria bacterium]